MRETEGIYEHLRPLAERIERQIQDWPESMRSPKPGTDLMWERVVKGGQEPIHLEEK